MKLFKSDHQAWVAEYEGHKIEVVNARNITLYIDGQEADQNKDLVTVACWLKGKLPDTDQDVIVFMNGMEDWTKVICHFIIGTELTVQRGTKDENGVFTPIGEDEE